MDTNGQLNAASRPVARVGTKAMTFRLHPDAHRQLKVLAAQNDRTVTSIVTEGLNYMFKQHGLPPIC